MIFEPFPEFLPSEYRVKFATEAWERREPRRCAGRCSATSRGFSSATIATRSTRSRSRSSRCRRSPCVAGRGRHGAHPRAEPGIWWGSRLAVAPRYRRFGARRLADPPRGLFGACARLPAFFCPCAGQNALMFQRLHWPTLEEIELHGRPHHLMQADLGHYPPIADAGDRIPLAAEDGRDARQRRTWRFGRELRAGRGLAAKRDIAAVAARLALSAECRCGRRRLRGNPGRRRLSAFAIEGFINEFVARDPWFAGWCGVMVNVSDIAAMGGRPIAVVDAIWAEGEAEAAPVLDGLRAAAQAYGVPIVGGHTNARTDRGQLSVAILGRANRLLTSFDARPADRLVAAIDLRGRYREPFSNWEAATDAPPARLARRSCGLAGIAEADLPGSQGYFPGRHRRHRHDAGGVLARRRHDRHRRVPRPAAAARALAADLPELRLFARGARVRKRPASLARFRDRGIAAADIGEFTADTELSHRGGAAAETIWDFAREPLMGCARPRWRHEPGKPCASRFSPIRPTRAAASCMRSNSATRWPPRSRGDGFCARRHGRRLLSRYPLPRRRVPRRRSAATCGRWSRCASPTMSAISSPRKPALRCLARAGRHFRQALATLKERGLIAGFARTVHHVDVSPTKVAALQGAPSSRPTICSSSGAYGGTGSPANSREACHVGNGVDMARFSPVADATDAELRARLNLPTRCSGLSVDRRRRRAQEHHSHPAGFPARAARSTRRPGSSSPAALRSWITVSIRRDLPACWPMAAVAPRAVIRTGALRQKLMPALYRVATALVFPSIKEGFGLGCWKRWRAACRS